MLFIFHINEQQTQRIWPHFGPNEAGDAKVSRGQGNAVYAN